MNPEPGVLNFLNPWGFNGIMEMKMETTIMGYIGIIGLYIPLSR